jgi:hypothetical protein
MRDSGRQLVLDLLPSLAPRFPAGLFRSETRLARPNYLLGHVLVEFAYQPIHTPPGFLGRGLATFSHRKNETITFLYASTGTERR